MENAGPVVLVVGVVGLIGGLIWLAYWLEKKRTEFMQGYAESKGLTFLGANQELWKQLETFKLFGQGHSRKLRNAIHDTCEPLELQVASSGTHPFAVSREVSVSRGERQAAVYGSMRELARREPTFALHVHVGFADPEDAIRVYNRMRVHLPMLLALSANSPFWQGRDTGLASSRTPLFQAFPRVGVPRRFETFDEWVQTVDLKFTQTIPIYKRVKGELYFNVLNLGNLLNRKWGLQQEVVFSYGRAIAGTTYDPATNQYVYTFTPQTLDPVPVVNNDQPVSRWQLQSGIRIRF